MQKPNFFPFQTLGLTLLLFLVTTALYSQSPLGIPYQAVVSNVNGSVMSNAAVNMIFKIHDGTASGSVVYEESHALTSNAQGLVTCVVGNGVVSQGNFSNIPWGSGAKFLHVEMNIGNGEMDLGTQQMLSVPYALYAGACEISVSEIGDTLYSGNGNFVIVPGISESNYPLPLAGCINPLACNYNPNAIDDDGSCLFQGASCDDGNDQTTNDLINSDCSCFGYVNGIYILGQGVTDVDGNFYTTAIYGNTEWMTENLKTSKFRDGTIISNVSANPTSASVLGGYVFPGNNALNNEQYGKLYNWYAVARLHGLCPSGWHVPSVLDWQNLASVIEPGATLTCSGSWNPNPVLTCVNNTLGPKLRAVNFNGNNQSGFSARGAGGGNADSVTNWDELDFDANWWTTTTINSSGYYTQNEARFAQLQYNDNSFKWPYVNTSPDTSPFSYFYSVRCIKD